MDDARGWSSRLDAAFDHVWNRLDDAARRPASPLRRLIIANGGAAGADARVMVLRDCDRAAATLAFHTDVRSPKIAAFAADPRVAIVGYDHDAAYQLRLHGVAVVLTDGPQWAAALAAVRDTDRRNYMTVRPPGAESALPDDGQPPVPDPDAVVRNFARVVVTLQQIEWLDLARPGHRRASYVRDAHSWTGSWRLP
jgi:hypothetical protein